MAKKIPPHKVDEIYAAASILDVVGEYVDLKKRGSNWFGLSPFVSEKTPSFAVSPSKNIFKCFSSGKGGNSVTFLMEAEGMTYVEALSHIAKRYGIELDLEESPEEEFTKDHRDSLYILNEWASKYFHDKLLEPEAGAVALSYFKERGILQTTIDTFRLGYHPEGWDHFSKEAVKQQYKEDFLVETGLSFRSEKDGRLMDRFRGRIMFPIWNHLGKVVGFGGRIMGKVEGVAKYVNSPESEIYHKSKILFGLYQARQAIRDQDLCILVEGYMDMIALFQAGIQNGVASSGTALTEDQIRLIKRFTANVLLVYDSDRAGIHAALRGVDLLLENELNVKVLLLPEGHDPDSYVKEVGKSGWDIYAKSHASDFLDFKIDHLLKGQDPNDPQAKTKIVHEVAETIAKIPDDVRRAIYAEAAARRAGVPEAIMARAVEQALQAKLRQEKRAERFQELRNQSKEIAKGATPLPDVSIQEEVAGRKEDQEKEILRLLINYHDRQVTLEGHVFSLPEAIFQALQDNTFDTVSLEKFRQELQQQFNEKGVINIHPFLNHEDLAIASTATRLITIPDEVSPNWGKFAIHIQQLDSPLEKSVESAILHFHRAKINRLIQENSEKIRTCTQPEELDELILKKTYLDKIRKDLALKLGIVIHD